MVSGRTSLRFAKSLRRMRHRRRRRAPRRAMTAGRVKRIIDAELKFVDLDLGPLPMPSVTGDVSDITNNINQGDLVNNRIGNWIKPVTWYCTITVEGNPLNPINTALYRLIAVVWKENESINAIALNKIVQSVVFPHQGFRVQNKGQFKVLWSRTGILSNNTDNPQFQKMHRFYVKPSMKALYDGANARNNQLFLIVFSDIDTVDDPPTFEFSSRLRFTDS